MKVNKDGTSFIEFLIYSWVGILMAAILALSMDLLSNYNDFIQVTPYSLLLYISGFAITSLFFWLKFPVSGSFQPLNQKSVKGFCYKLLNNWEYLLIIIFALLELVINKGSHYGDFIFIGIGSGSSKIIFNGISYRYDR